METILAKFIKVPTSQVKSEISPKCQKTYDRTIRTVVRSFEFFIYFFDDL